MRPPGGGWIILKYEKRYAHQTVGVGCASAPLPVGAWVNVEVDIAGVLHLPNVRVRQLA